MLLLILGNVSWSMMETHYNINKLHKVRDVHRRNKINVRTNLDIPLAISCFASSIAVAPPGANVRKESAYTPPPPSWPKLPHP